MNEICSTKQEGSLLPVVQTNNLDMVPNPTSQSSLEACIAHCGLADDFLFYYDNNMMCSCNPDLRSRLYMDIFNSTEITRVYAHPDDLYISCEDLSSGVEQSTASVWTNTQPFKRYNDYSRGPFIAHILPCDMSGRGWTVIQRRVDGAVDFNRPYLDYVNGFGNAGGNFWIGLESIYQLTAAGAVQLRITLETWEDTEDLVISYSSFGLENGDRRYRLMISGYSGTVGDCLVRLNGVKFSAYDLDHDDDDTEHCALKYSGGWWFDDCHESHLNGIYYNIPQAAFGMGIQWSSYKGYLYSFKGTSMSVL